MGYFADKLKAIEESKANCLLRRFLYLGTLFLLLSLGVQAYFHQGDLWTAHLAPIFFSTYIYFLVSLFLNRNLFRGLHSVIRWGLILIVSLASAYVLIIAETLISGHLYHPEIVDDRHFPAVFLWFILPFWFLYLLLR